MNAWITPMNRSKGFQTRSPIGTSQIGSRCGEHRQHQAPGEEVAEEPERERDRLRDLLDHVDGRHDLVGLDVVPDVPTDASGPDRVVVHERDDDDRHRQGQVHVRGGCREPLGAVATRDRLDPVAGPDEQEDDDRQRHEAAAGGSDGGVRDLLDLLDDEFPEQLQLPGALDADPRNEGGDRGRSPRPRRTRWTTRCRGRPSCRGSWS